MKPYRARLGGRVQVSVPLLMWRALLLLSQEEYRDPRQQLLAMLDDWWHTDPRRPDLEKAVFAFWTKPDDWPDDMWNYLVAQYGNHTARTK